MRRAERFLLGALSIGLNSACPADTTRPPVAEVCPPEGPCTLPIGTSRGPTPRPDGGGEGGGAGDGTLNGRVLEILTDSFAAGALHREPAWVEVEGSSGRLLRAEWNGQEDAFSIEGFTPSASTWFSVRPSAGDAWLRTLQLVDTQRYSAFDLSMVSSDVVSTLFSLVSVPVTPSSTGGHALVQFYTGGTPKSGVQVSAVGAELVAYASSGTWSRDEDRTDASGAVLIGNVPAASFPGSSVEVRLAGSLTGNVTFPIARQAITLVRVQAESP